MYPYTCEKFKTFSCYFFHFYNWLQNNFSVYNFRKSGIVYSCFYLPSKNVTIKGFKNSRITIFFYFRNFLFTFKILSKKNVSLNLCVV